MTRYKHAHTGLVTPQLPQHWLTAALRVFAMLVLNVASTFQMIRRRDPVIGTQATPTDLPRAKTDTQSKETNPAAKHRSPLQSAHAEQRRFAARSSKHERVLTALSPSFLRKQEPRSYTHRRMQPLAFGSRASRASGMTNTGGWKHLRSGNALALSIKHIPHSAHPDASRDPEPHG